MAGCNKMKPTINKPRQAQKNQSLLLFSMRYNFVMLRKTDWLYLILSTLAGILLVSDLFLHQGRPVTFDGPTHLTTMAQFYEGLTDGDFPVVWANNFANYGLPIPMLAQQTTSYLGAGLFALTQNLVLSYNLVWLIGSVVSSCLVYLLLRQFFDPESSLVGTLFFDFAPYRIINIYIRGALPEFYIGLCIPLMLLGLLLTKKARHSWGFFLFLLGN